MLRKRAGGADTLIGYTPGTSNACDSTVLVQRTTPVGILHHAEKAYFYYTRSNACDICMHYPYPLGRNPWNPFVESAYKTAEHATGEKIERSGGRATVLLAEFPHHRFLQTQEIIWLSSQLSPHSCLAAACFDVTLLATLLALLVFLGTILDLVVSAATTVAQLALGALRNRMVGFAAVEAALHARGTLFLAFLLWATAAYGFDVTRFTALATDLILFGAVCRSMVGAAAALAELGFGTVGCDVAFLPAVVTLPRPGLLLGLLFCSRLVACRSTSFLAAYFRDVPNLAAV